MPDIQSSNENSGESNPNDQNSDDKNNKNYEETRSTVRRSIIMIPGIDEADTERGVEPDLSNRAVSFNKG